MATILSCSESSDPLPNEINQVEAQLLSNEELEEVAHIFASFINEEEVRKELLSYATKEMDFEVQKSFKDILSGDDNARKESLLARRILEATAIGCANCRTGSLSLEEILSEEYQIYAPYLAENFTDSNEPMTITWWDGIDTTGVTPGILTEDINGRTTNQIFPVDDSYASSHPTIVLIPLDDAIFEELCAVGDPCDTGGTSNSSSGSSINYTPRDIDCRDLKSDDLIELRMPKFILHKNTRGWPSPNYLWLWTVTGTYSIGSNGQVVPNDNSQDIFVKKKVSRSNVGKWRDTGSSFIVSNWTKERNDLRIIVAYKRGVNDLEVTGEIGIDVDGDYKSETKTKYTVKSNDKANLMFNKVYDRCSVLATITSDTGQGTYEGYRIYSEQDFSFYLVPDIR